MHYQTSFEIHSSNNMRYAPDTIFLKTRSEVKVSDPKMVCGTPSSKDASKHNIWNSYLKEYKRYAQDTIIPKTRSDVKVTVTRKWYVTLDHRSKSVTRKWYKTLHHPKMHLHTKWNSYLKEHRRFAPDSMQFLETRSEVMFNVIVTKLWYATLCHPKMHSHTKFEIPASNNMSYRIILKTRS